MWHVLDRLARDDDAEGAVTATDVLDVANLERNVIRHEARPRRPNRNRREIDSEHALSACPAEAGGKAAATASDLENGRSGKQGPLLQAVPDQSVPR
jgi:hypothetical protein